jgi:hypothetical protein
MALDGHGTRRPPAQTVPRFKEKNPPMAGTIRGLAIWILSPECKNVGWQTHPPGQPPSRSSDTSGLSVVLRWGRFLALRMCNGGCCPN